MADDDEPADPIGNEPSPLLFFAAGIIPLLLVGGWFLFRSGRRAFRYNRYNPRAKGAVFRLQ